ncbi:dipeptide/oligopeptide/nickel ABC transporter permease/ATP-binding protein [Aureimonas altamirensis]|uniref:dipeptide/oligopeptide/nickel ABC transporter permease/ATP-binding protein n=1 Tax=Aureimonas altamirensis TaxID=370622 RepID=UPI000A699869|nr:dipeptide/oligopeptide/nickel ABC transporter permease/ATP-binding protein [Aureimonas altamirensis]
MAVTTATPLTGDAARGASRKRALLRSGILHALVRQPKGLVGLTLVILFVAMALFGAYVTPYDPYAQSFANTLKAPSAAHWFGTDQLGRDVFSRVLTGARTSLGIGIGGVAIAFLIGVPIGMFAALRPGRIDFLVMRGVDIMMSFPDIVFALAIVAILGANTQNVIIAVGVVSIPVFARTARAVTSSILSEPYIEGSRSLGCSPARIVLRHVLPNISGILLTLSSLLFATTLLSASGLSFLGLGTQPPEPEWGTMLGESRSYLRSHPHLATFPGLCLALAALGFNLLGEALRNIFDPTTARRSPVGSILASFLGVRTDRSKPAGDKPAGRSTDEPVKAQQVRVAFFPDIKPVEVLRGVDFTAARGRTTAIVGESGSGKSTFLRVVATLLPGQAQVTGGSVEVAGTDVTTCTPAQIRKLRRRRIGIIFQDAASALNPVMTVGDQLLEAIREGGGSSRKDAWQLAADLLTDVGIGDAQNRLDMYPHQFSGGMKQRIVIAMALAQDPEILLADEPTSALDVTIQQQILLLLRNIQTQRRMTLILVTHDLGLVARYADDVAVMYAGNVVEFGSVDNVLTRPAHPYTRALKDSSPAKTADGVRRRLPSIAGEPPFVGNLPDGCAFHPRCRLGADRTPCRTVPPVRRRIESQSAACHFAEEQFDVAS